MLVSMDPALPSFVYHPDPLATGSIVASMEQCERCGDARGFVYRGPIYAVEEAEFICPWCIADGSAAEMLAAQFTDADRAPADVPQTVVDEVLERTPGFAGWQQEEWQFHCSDAAQYLGRIDYQEAVGFPGVVDELLADGWSADALTRMTVDGELTGYLFRCRHCGRYLAYADCA